MSKTTITKCDDCNKVIIDTSYAPILELDFCNEECYKRFNKKSHSVIYQVTVERLFSMLNVNLVKRKYDKLFPNAGDPFYSLDKAVAIGGAIDMGDANYRADTNNRLEALKMFAKRIDNSFVTIHGGTKKQKSYFIEICKA